MRLAVEPVLNIIPALVPVRVRRSDVLVQVRLRRVVPLELQQQLIPLLHQFIGRACADGHRVRPEEITSTDFGLDRRDFAVPA